MTMGNKEGIIGAGMRMGTYRKLRGMKQVDAAELLGVTQPHLSRVELGRTPPSLDLLERAADLYGITLKDLWEDVTPVEKTASAMRLVEVDERQRALRCPRCCRNGYSDQAVYCPNCAFPLYNLCSAPEHHTNAPSARFCEICGSKTYWGMTADELEKAGVPPLP